MLQTNTLSTESALISRVESVLEEYPFYGKHHRHRRRWRRFRPQLFHRPRHGVDDAVSRGARVLAGGEAVGACYRATLLTDVPEDSDFARHETFGPVAAIEIVGSAEEAVERANATAYGLSAGLITQNIDRGLELARGIDSGIVHVNDQTVADEPHVPFGGTGASGNGTRIGGPANWEEFTHWQWVTIKDKPNPYPF